MRYPFTYKPKLKAFTLIELSIVLVIIGLIVGGVLVGKDLIEAAKLRKTASELEHQLAAINTFKIKYNCLPGDCKNSTQFFGTSNNNGNGNGNDIISFLQGSNGNEGLLAAYQLSAAGLFGNIARAASNIPDIRTDILNGITVPVTPLGNDTRWTIRDNGAHWIVGTTFSWGSTYLLGRDNDNVGTENWLLLDKVDTSWPPLQNSALTPTQASYIDSKIDDGKPAAGKIIAGTGAGTCINESFNPLALAASTVTYAVTNSNVGCTLGYKLW